jgi:hypothetical protein
VIKTGEDKFKRQVLDCCALVSTKNKSKMEKAVQELTGLLTTDVGRESVMLTHALATTYMIMKQVRPRLASSTTYAQLNKIFVELGAQSKDPVEAFGESELEYGRGRIFGTLLAPSR